MNLHLIWLRLVFAMGNTTIANDIAIAVISRWSNQVIDLWKRIESRKKIMFQNIQLVKTGLEQRKFVQAKGRHSLIRQAKITITSVFKITTLSVCHNDKSQRTVETHTFFVLTALFFIRSPLLRCLFKRLEWWWSSVSSPFTLVSIYRIFASWLYDYLPFELAYCTFVVGFFFFILLLGVS